MIEIYLIRHGMTEGNKYRRYIGSTDESLCEEGKNQLKSQIYPEPEILFVSPLKRCRETAAILFPAKEYIIIDDLSECNFGEFENKNYQELSNVPSYQKWIDSNGTLPFPGGESPDEFRKRCTDAFREIVGQCIRSSVKKAAMVVHGGTIMSVMSAYATEPKEYYQWNVKNGEGYRVWIDESEWLKGNLFTYVL